MDSVSEGKTLTPVAGVKVEVIGGYFQVSEIFVGDDTEVEAVIAKIRDTPADRWFVMLSGAEGSTKDVLSIIDEEMEFQSVALGRLENN